MIPKPSTLTDNKIILASSSPRRKELLERIGLRFEVIPSEIEERAIAGETPIEHVMRLAKEKTFEVANNLKASCIIGADTIVLLDGEILGKPAGEDEARRMLQRLSGREHKVITGFCIFETDTKELITDYTVTRVMIKDLTEEEIEAYLKTEESFDKAGGYAIQGKGSFLVKEIKGSYTNVVGLPLCEVVEALQRAGAVTSLRSFDNGIK